MTFLIQSLTKLITVIQSNAFKILQLNETCLTPILSLWYLIFPGFEIKIKALQIVFQFILVVQEYMAVEKKASLPFIYIYIYIYIISILLFNFFLDIWIHNLGKPKILDTTRKTQKSNIFKIILLRKYLKKKKRKIPIYKAKEEKSFSCCTQMKKEKKTRWFQI